MQQDQQQPSPEANQHNHMTCKPKCPKLNEKFDLFNNTGLNFFPDQTQKQEGQDGPGSLTRIF